LCFNGLKKPVDFYRLADSPDDRIDFLLEVRIPMTSRIRFTSLMSVVLLVGSPQPTPLEPASVLLTCTPYLPDGGLFYTVAPFQRVTSTPVQGGVYSISLNTQQQVVVIQGNTTSPDALVQVPPGMLAFFFFYGANNRFLVLDLHTDPSNSSVSINYQQAVLDLTAWSPGQPAQLGHFLAPVSEPTTAQLHIYPSPGYTAGSSGNGLAFFVWYGLSNGQIENAGIYRSDNGAQLCFAQSFTAVVQVQAKVTPTSVQILDGAQPVVPECPLPRGVLTISPPSHSFGSVVMNTTATFNFTFTNTGNDCLTVSAISSTAPFQPVNFSSFVLAAGTSRAVPVAFQPTSTGTFAATLTVTSTPALRANTIAVSGSSTPPPLPRLTVNKVLLPPGDPGLFNLLVNSVPKATNVGSGGSTGPLVMSVGSSTVGEVAVPPTALSTYTTSINCGAGRVSGAVATVNLAQGDNKTCTITNLGPPRLTVNNVLLPAGDPGTFNLQIDGVTIAVQVGNAGSTGQQVESIGNHTVGETAGSGTSLASYVTSIDCGAGSAAGASSTVSLAPGDNKTCTIINRGPPRLAVNKILQPTGDPGRFNLQIDGVTYAADVRDGGRTGLQIVTAGAHTVGEMAGMGSSLSNYRVVIGDDCTANGNVTLAAGESKTCSITNIGPEPFLAWKGASNDQAIYYTTGDGTTWATQQVIPNVGTSVGPSVTVYNGKLFLAWKGASNDQQIFYTTGDGTTWAPQQVIANVGTNYRPSLITWP